MWEVSADDLARLPDDLRQEVLERAEFLVKAGSDAAFETALQLDTGEVTWENIVSALRRERDAEVAELFRWADESDDDDTVAEFNLVAEPWDHYAVSKAVLRHRDHPRVAAFLPRLEQLAADRTKALSAARARAIAGLRSYAESVPKLARAAREGYAVQAPALEHFIEQIQACDPEASLVLAETSHEWAQSKTEDRKAPDEVAFRYFDKVKAHLDALPKPDGVDVELCKIQRFRHAVQDPKKNWTCAPPATAVLVKVDGKISTRRLIFFVAEN